MQHCFLLTQAVLCFFSGWETPDTATESRPTITIETTSRQDLEQTALADFQEGNYAKAIERAQKIIKQNPKSLPAVMLVGDASFMMGNIKQSIESYDRVIELKPQLEPQLWQRGLALYYAERFQDGKDQFETHQSYNTQDVENAVWHLLCNSKIVGLDKARENFIPITKDARVPMKQIHQLFGGTGDVEAVFTAARTTPAVGRTKAIQIYYAHLYTGLYYDMIGDQAKAIAEMREAAKVNPLRKDLLMGRVADVHLMIRKASGPDTHPDATNPKQDKTPGHRSKN
jgi:lipoprotein NlpI